LTIAVGEVRPIADQAPPRPDILAGYISQAIDSGLLTPQFVHCGC
jgi:hypothetical protein